ncbi:MAG: Flp pilus assembly complex ATPase component TadA, partial [Deltaproteobacteria bacterium]|nr:Flp pilus assembly complex ATPase component TadA [Deltaproteobacteria bacterium]
MAGQQPILRIRGEMEPVKYKALDNDTLKAMLYEICPEEKIKVFEETGDVDFGYEIPNLARYRSNFFQQKNGIAAVFREIPSKILTCEQLGLPTVIPKLAMLPKGMVVVTGPTGSGKSTTLAAIIDEANKTRKHHILTVEDPIEFVHVGQKAIINHREIGTHTRSFAAALRGALREDPDIILVGEIRDFETAEIAVKAALTGHLVLSTLHTNDAPSTVNRLLNMGIEPFLISSSVILILAQRLVRKICPECKTPVTLPEQAFIDLGVKPEEFQNIPLYKGTGCKNCSNTGFKGRIAIYEVMPLNENLKELILKGASSTDLKKEAIRSDMSTLRNSAINKMKQG